MSAKANVQTAAQELINDGEIIVGWCIVLEVVRPNGDRYLAHRAGGGQDGEQLPPMWTELGMLQAAANNVAADIRASTAPPGEEPPD